MCCVVGVVAVGWQGVGMEGERWSLLGGSVVAAALKSSQFSQAFSSKRCYKVQLCTSQDPYSMHTGCPVVRGVKWNAVAWLHGTPFRGERVE